MDNIIESKNVKFFDYIFCKANIIDHRKRIRTTSRFGAKFYIFLVDNDLYTFKQAIAFQSASLWKE